MASIVHIHISQSRITQKKEDIMRSEIIPIRVEDTNLEIMARIVKAASRKYNCDVEIDFSNNSRKVYFVGDEDLKPHITEEVLNMFDADMASSKD
jgi:hypothetical protein